LEEAVLADFLIHVLDATSPEIERFHETTLKVLGELGAIDKPTLTVLNKIDRVTDPARLAELRHLFPDALNISAFTGLGMEALLQRCSAVLADRVRRHRYRIPQSRADLLGMLHRDAKVLSTGYDENDILVTAVVPAAIAGRLEEFAE
jgi:GTP-binding protein HflX